MTHRQAVKDNEGNVWANSRAKEQLVKDLLKGRVPLEAAKMGPREVYLSR